MLQTELPKSPQFRQFQTRHQAFFYGQTLTQEIAPKKEQSSRSICLDNGI
jgi:hypothetical protein